MSEYKPRPRTQAAVLGSFFLMVLPAIWFAAMGYMWFLEHVLKLDTNARLEGLLDRLFLLLVVLPIIPTMLLGILAAGIPWMFLMARCLSWPDIQYFTSRKGPRLPVLSDWLDRTWLHMTESKRPNSSTTGPSR